ncbi:MAG: hypothetical protein Kow0058_00280 [Roseovarius sp.]
MHPAPPRPGLSPRRARLRALPQSRPPPAAACRRVWPETRAAPGRAQALSAARETGQDKGRDKGRDKGQDKGHGSGRDGAQDGARDGARDGVRDGARDGAGPTAAAGMPPPPRDSAPPALSPALSPACRWPFHWPAADQLPISAGMMVTMPGKNHRIASPSTWISTNGATPL